MSFINPSRTMDTTGIPSKKMYHGIYTASVVNNNDPKGENRVTMLVPQILGTAVSNWAVPLGFFISSPPPPGTLVHGMFLGGDLNYPVYYWGGM